MFKSLVLTTLLTLFCAQLTSQTVLSAGDIAVTAINGHANPDIFNFVTFVDLEGGTEILFTNLDANNTFTLPSGSGGVVKYTTPPEGLIAGRVIQYQSSGTIAEFSDEVAGFSISNSGDNVTAYQGTGLSVTTFLHVASTDGEYGTIPGGFSDIITIGTAHDGKYTGPIYSIYDSLYSKINNVNNWTTANNGVTPIATDKFRIGYYWDGSTWAPVSPGSTTFDDNIIVAAGGGSISNTVTTNGNVMIDSIGTLDLGAFTLTADTVFVESTEGGQGQVIGDISGVVAFESYITSASARWFNVASPVSGTLANMSFTNGGKINTLSDVGDTNFMNIYYYDTDSLNPGTSEGLWRPAGSKSALTDTTGYSIYLGGSFGTLPMTITTHGTLNNGTVSKDISTANGAYNFVNNPFASSIDFDELIVDNSNLNSTYYIFDDETGSYVSYSAPAGIPANLQFIGPGQAFFVNAGTATQVDFMLDQQTMSEPISLARSQGNVGVLLTVRTNDGNLDYTYVGLKPGLTDSYSTRYDGKKMMNPGLVVPNFYSILQNEEYVFKFVDDNFNSKSIPLNIEHAQNGGLEIEASLRSIDRYWSVELEDKFTGTITDLRFSNYQFAHDKANNPERFVLHINKSAVSIEEHSVNGVYAYHKRDVLMLDLTSIASNSELKVQIYDLSGKLVHAQLVNGGSVPQINLDGRSSGVYLLQVTMGEELIHTQKVVNN